MSDGQSHAYSRRVDARRRAEDRFGHLSNDEILDASTIQWALAAMLQIQVRAIETDLEVAQRDADDLVTLYFARTS